MKSAPAAQTALALNAAAEIITVETAVMVVTDMDKVDKVATVATAAAA